MILVTFSIGSGCYVYYKPYTIHHSMFDKPDLPSHLISSKWTDYLKDCSGAKIIENQVHAAHLFSQKYKDNMVEWDGFFIDFKNKGGQGGYFKPEMSILVKMNPSESDNFADIVLTIPNKAYEANKITLDGLAKGDHLKFKAKIRSMGNEFKLNHLSL